MYHQPTRPSSNSLREHPRMTNGIPSVANSGLATPTHPLVLRTDLIIFDARTASHTLIQPSDQDSEDDIQGYWPEQLPQTPPNPNSPQHAAITDEQFADWFDSQLPWNEFRHSIPAFKNMPQELCGTPIIYRLFLNYQHIGPYSRPPRRIRSHFIVLPDWTILDPVYQHPTPTPTAQLPHPSTITLPSLFTNS